jgi:hypothetical protein
MRNCQQPLSSSCRQLQRSDRHTPPAQQEEASPVPDTPAHSDTTLPREPGPVPAARAGSQVAADEEEENPSAEMKVPEDFLAPDKEGEEPAPEEVVMTPLLNAEAVIELMSHMLRQMTLSGSRGRFARESIRDYDNGPGRFRWNKRSPYCSKREPCVDKDDLGMKYRRRMKPLIKGESLVWEPELSDNEVASDDQLSSHSLHKLVPMTKEVSQVRERCPACLIRWSGRRPLAADVGHQNKKPSLAPALCWRSPINIELSGE